MTPEQVVEHLECPQAASLTEEDLDALREAKRLLEHPSLTARISDMLGGPIETGFNMLPRRLHGMIATATETALLRGLEFAIKSIGAPDARRSRNRLHKLLAVGTGAAGGAVGVAGLPVELPISTCIMLRSIADIARSEEHDISLLEVKLSCLEVFAFGGKGSADDATESGYWIVRGALSTYISEAANHLAKKGLADKTAPALVRLVAQISARFGLVISEKTAATVVPVAGALSGGTINYLFMDHFQDMARGHFTVKRLEKKYGIALVRSTYERLVV